jgi:intracellular multiplication protein IcmD
MIKILLPLALVLGAVFVSTAALADPATQGLALKDVSDNIKHTVGSLAVILNNVALIAGIGFVLASFFKFHQHKLNPTQVPMSQGITLLLIGAGLTLFPIIIPTAKTAVAGSDAQVSKLSGGEISKLIGNNDSN